MTSKKIRRLIEKRIAHLPPKNYEQHKYFNEGIAFVLDILETVEIMQEINKDGD